MARNSGPRAPGPAAADREVMEIAVRAGARGLARTRPDPPEAAVLAVRGLVVARRARTREGGRAPWDAVLDGRHAWPRGPRALFLTVEPGASGAALQAWVSRLRDRRIRRVILGARRPGAGRRLRRALSEAGIEVEIQVSPAAAELVRPWAHHRKTGRPFVRLKSAASADGRIATRTGASRWITSAPARRLGHRWRGETDAIMVGVGTVLADDPRLDCRVAAGRDPIRVVVDSGLRTSPRAALFRHGKGAVWVAATNAAPPTRVERLRRRGAEVLSLPSRRGRVDLKALLTQLGEAGLHSVLVEGGAELAGGLLRAGLVDEIRWFSAPLLIGGDGLSMIGPLGATRMDHALRLTDMSVQMVGPDALHIARVKYEG